MNFRDIADVNCSAMTWHQNCNDFNSRIEASAKDINFNDTVFLLTQPDAENPDGDEVSANKAILALISPVFYAQFFGPLANTNDGPIEIVDGTAQGFKQLIDFICKPDSFELDVDHVAEAFNISYFAHKYQIQSLISFCRQYLGSVCLEDKELDTLNWAVSTQRGLEMKAAFPIEHALAQYIYWLKNTLCLVVHNCWEFIEINFKEMFPNGKLKEEEDLPDKDVMIKILGRSSKLLKPELVLSVALDYYCKQMDKSQKIVKGRKRLKMNDEKEWDKKLEKIKSIVQLQNVRPKKLDDIYEKFFKKIPDGIMVKITKEMTSTWKNIDTFTMPRLNTGGGHEAKFSIASRRNYEDWIHADQLTSGVEIKFKINQNAIMRLDFNEIVNCSCRDSNCCMWDSTVFQCEDSKEEISHWNSDTDIADGYFYVKEKEAVVTYERKCGKKTCTLHLVRMKEFNFSKENFKMDVLEVNGQPVSVPCYTFIQNVFFTPI